MNIGVLLVDDHAVMREGLRAILEASGDITVVGEAGDGLVAVKEAARLRPDVVIMDISMPNRNGIEATSLVLAAAPETRVIILSAHSASENIHRVLRAGAQGYLLKESAGAEVVAAVRAVHAGRRYLSAQIADAVLDDYTRMEGPADTLETLSAREREILQLVAEGKTSAEMGAILCLSPKTVETYRSRLMQKIGVADVPSLVKFAIRHGVVALQ